MEQFILEPCCYRKHLNQWYADCHDKLDVIPMLNNGDVTVDMLLSWCIDMAFGKNDVVVTICMANPSPSLISTLQRNRKVNALNILTSADCKSLSTDIITVSGYHYHFVFQGSLLQSVCPGKYITTLGITQRYYDSIQPLLNSWLRLYSKRAE